MIIEHSDGRTLEVEQLFKPDTDLFVTYIGDTTGEGGEFDNDKFFEAIAAFYNENF